MNSEGIAKMDKVFGEDDIKGLEEEIDSAVDRLFVEKKAGPTQTVSKHAEPAVKEQPFRVERDFDFEAPSPEPPAARPPATPAVKSLEKMEGQLLSLEWEINKENLAKAKEEVLALRQGLKESPEVGSVLGLMAKVLDDMGRNEEKIRPPAMKFLMDCKETLKLLMRREADSELNTYKDLAYRGIEARYSCLEQMGEAQRESRAPSGKGEIEKAGILTQIETLMGELSKKMDLFITKTEGLHQKVDTFLEKADQSLAQPSGRPATIRSIPTNITVFRVEGRFLGVESDKIYKLFKVPMDRRDRYVDQQTIRVKDLDVRLIDLRKVFSIPRGAQKAETKILTVVEDGEYKGLMIDQVIERLSTEMETGGDYGECFAGIAHWTYQERPIEVSILDLKKF